MLGNRSDINWFERVRELLTVHWGCPPDAAMTPRLAMPQPPEPLWTALYASPDHGLSLSVSGGPGEISIGGRRIPVQPDGRYRRNPGVEPMTFEIPGDLSQPPREIIRHEGNVRVRLMPAATTTPPDPTPLIGVYRHPDLPGGLHIGHEPTGAAAAARRAGLAARRLAATALAGRALLRRRRQGRGRAGPASAL